MADNIKKNYPHPNFLFQLDWGGTRFSFTEVSGLNFSKTKQPGLTEYKSITLKRGTFFGDFDSFEQLKKNMMFQEGKIKSKRDITIRLVDDEQQPIMSWTLAKAWPTKVTSTDLKADGNEVAIKSIELVREGLSNAEIEQKKKFYNAVDFHFAVEFSLRDSKPFDIKFQSIIGLDSTLDAEAIKTGGEHPLQHVIPTRRKFGPLVLKRGLLGPKNSEIKAWLKQTFQDKPFESSTKKEEFKVVDTVIIKLLGEAQQPLLSWTVTNV